MTLKDYFRLSQTGNHPIPQQIKQIEQENTCSSNQPVTPCFNNNKRKLKIKTEISEHKQQSQHKQIFLKSQKNHNFLSFENKTKLLKMQKITNQPHPNINIKTIKTKRSFTLESTQKQHLNRSTVTSFYHIQNKNKKMLNKVKQEKQRVKELKLSDAFFITKYAEKFRITSRNIQ